MLRPIVVACTGRSGSSLIASIFAAHGVWVGRCVKGDAFNPRGYFEHTVFKPLIEAACPPRADRCAKPDRNWRAVVQYVLATGGYRGGPWLVKHTALAWPIWRDFSPLWVLPRRDPEAVFASARRAGFSSRLDDAQLRASIAYMNRQLDLLRDTRGGIDIDAEWLVAGDTTQIVRALRAAHLEPDLARIERAVEPGLWSRPC